MDYFVDMDASEIGRRIREARLSRNLTLKDLSKLAGVAVSTISSLELGGSKDPQSSTLNKLAAGLGLEPGYFGGRGKASDSELAVVPLNTHRDGLIPLLEEVIGTTNDLPEFPYIQGISDKWLYCHAEHSEHTFYTVHCGDSMVSDGPISFPDGTYIAFDRKRKARSGDYVAARLVSSGIIVFRQYISDAGTIMLRPLNRQYPNIYDEFVVEAVAVEQRLPLI